jgi:GNAT superfamily N-acetyltransferase
MTNLSRYSAMETLRDGRGLEVRALRPDDREGMLAAVDHTSAQSLYRRFFGAKRNFTDKEIAFFLNVDFANHVALVAVTNESGGSVIVGGGRYVLAQPGQAEMAFAVVDHYQGQGVGTVLLRHLIGIAREAGLKTLTAEVLADNTPMLKLFQRSGLAFSQRREAQVVYVTLRMT